MRVGIVADTAELRVRGSCLSAHCLNLKAGYAADYSADLVPYNSILHRLVPGCNRPVLYHFSLFALALLLSINAAQATRLPSRAVVCCVEQNVRTHLVRNKVEIATLVNDVFIQAAAPASLVTEDSTASN
jgi:hypothetical protein